MSDILYWRGNSEVRSDILAVVRGSGYTIQVLPSFEGVLDQVRKKKPRAVIVDASGGDHEVGDRIVMLSDATLLHRVPIIFLGNHATLKTQTLKKQYERLLAIDLPFNLIAMLEGLRELAPLPTAAPQVVELAKPAPPASGEDEFIPAQKPPKVTRLVKPPKSVGETLRRGLIASAEGDATLVGAHPNQPIFLRALSQLTEKNPWLGNHGRRVAGVSSALGTALGHSDEDGQIVRRAALVLNWGLREQRPFYSSVDLFFPENEIYLARILAGFRASAKFLTQIINDEAGAKVILDACEALDTSSAIEPTDSKHLTMLVSEFVDRAVWGSGRWDPFGAHRAIRRLRQGVPLAIDSELLDATSRVLVDATSTQVESTTPELPPKFMLPPADKALVDDAIKEAITLFSDVGQITLPLPDLRPGMVLARPLISEDGRLVLRSNVEVSEEILHRLMQLSMIRPLRAPVVLSNVSTVRL